MHWDAEQPPKPDDTELDELIDEAEDFAEAIWHIGEKYEVPLTNNYPRWQDGRYLRHCGDFYGDIMDAVDKFCRSS